MSDPVKNSDIEDVLSSIRRLVSENHSDSAPVEEAEQRLEPQAELADPEPKAKRSLSERLVLAPSFRVEEAQTEAVEAQSMSPVVDTPFVKSLKEDVQTLRDNLPSFLQERQDHSQVAESVDESAEHVELMEEDDLHASSADMVEDVNAQLENTLQFPAPEELTFESARASVDETIQETADDMRPWEIEGERLSEWHSVRANRRLSDAAGFEPDAPEDGDNAGMPVSALDWEDHEGVLDSISVEPANDELDVISEPVIEEPEIEAVVDTVVDTVVEEAAPIEAESYEAVLDEEMLRDLVGEIVRQELQGPLGERITRNVRKLVRREINRALTARSFDDG